MKKYLQLIRIKHYIKNILIFLPMVCANIVTVNNTTKCILAFLSFSFASSFIYIINDVRDIEKDKLHPTKKKRPLPSGMIKKNVALVIAFILLVLSITITVFIQKQALTISLLILFTYMLINILYSFGLKNIAILDVVLLATGFVLRVYYGASIVNVTVSDWLFLTIMSASLFMGLGKRKKELVKNKNVRSVLAEYNESFLDKFQYVTLSLTLVFYSLWAIEQSTKYLVFTDVLLMVIFMKYSLLIEKSDEGDPTTILYQDKFLLILCIIYGLAMLYLMVF